MSWVKQKLDYSVNTVKPILNLGGMGQPICLMPPLEGLIVGERGLNRGWFGGEGWWMCHIVHVTSFAPLMFNTFVHFLGPFST